MVADTLVSARPARPPLWRVYLVILLPMMLTNVLQSAAGTMDGIYLGRMINADAIASASAFFPVFFLLLSIVIGISSGATVLIGQAWGAKEPEKLRIVAGTAWGLILGAGILVAIIGSLAAPFIMTALGTPANILEPAILYARLMMLAMPLIFLLWLSTSMSRGVNDAVTPLLALALATVISMLVSPALIAGWLGLPQLGVASPAIATMVAFLAALLWLGWYWRRKHHPLAPRAELLRHMRLDPAIAGKILRIGLPGSLQMMTMAAAEMVLIGLVNRYGSGATAAYGAAGQVMSWVQLPAMSLGITTTILASHAIGAGRIETLGAITMTGFRLNLVVTGGFVALGYIFAPAMIGLFLKDPEIAALATTLFHTVVWSILLLGMANVLTGTMRASGTVYRPTILTILCIVAVELPAAYALNHWIGLAGIWWAYAATFFAILVVQGAFYRFVWRRQRIERLI